MRPARSSHDARTTVLLGAAPFAVVMAVACGGASAVGPSSSDPAATGPEPSHTDPAPKVSRPIAGTSDGVSCEEAEAKNVDEVDMKGGGQADLTSNDYGQILNAGAYLVPCNVPQESKVDVCVAVQNGSAVGVTVSLDPRSPETELCVAQQIRALTFPPHPKMDIAKVHF